jgi:hypothetical protein
MGTPARFSYGVTNAGPQEPMASLGMLDPTKFHAYFNDFDAFVAGDWVITTVEAGTGAATEALTAGDGGLLLVTNDDADDDSDFFQKTPAAFTLEAGKKAFFVARFKVSDATQSDLVFGLQIVDTTPLDATDGIYFQKDDGDALLDFYCRKNATTGSTSALGVATLANDTFVNIAWAYDGAGEVKAYVDGVHVGTLDASSAYLPDAAVTLSFGMANGSAGAKTLTVDYIGSFKERG